MKKNALLLRLDVLLAGILFLVAGSGLLEHHPPPSVHSALVILLFLVSLFHVALHWPWVKHAFSKYSQLPKQARANVHIVAALLITYTFVACTGWLASHAAGRLARHALMHLHQGLGLSAIVLQCWHIARHWGWVKITWTRSFTRKPRAS